MATNNTLDAENTHQRRNRNRRRNNNEPHHPHLSRAEFMSVVIGCTIGTFVQYYDLFIIFFFQADIEVAWFPEWSSSTISLILYGIPYTLRPFAGIFWGQMADRNGRRDVLIKTTFGIGISTFLMAAIPKFSTIGYWSVVFVIILRMAQSIFVAGEFSNSALYIYEQTGNESNFAFAQGLMWMGSTGSILAVIMRLILLPYVNIEKWIFRIPFILGFVVMFLVYYIRSKLPVDAVTDRLHNPAKYVIRNLGTYWHTIVILFISVLFPVIAHSASFYWLPDYLFHMHEPRDTWSYYGLIISMIIALTIMVYVGRLADRYDRMYKRVRISVVLNLQAMITMPLLMTGIADTDSTVALTFEQVSWIVVLILQIFYLFFGLCSFVFCFVFCMRWVVLCCFYFVIFSLVLFFVFEFCVVECWVMK